MTWNSICPNGLQGSGHHDCLETLERAIAISPVLGFGSQQSFPRHISPDNRHTETFAGERRLTEPLFARGTDPRPASRLFSRGSRLLCEPNIWHPPPKMPSSHGSLSPRGVGRTLATIGSCMQQFSIKTSIWLVATQLNNNLRIVACIVA